MKLVPKKVYRLYHGAFFYPLLGSFHLQIAYRKVKNLQIGVVGKVSINLLRHVKFIASRKVSCLCNQHTYGCYFKLKQHLHNTNAIIIWCLHKVFQENKLRPN